MRLTSPRPVEAAVPAGVILVVDDTEENRFVAARWLQRAGFSCVLFGPGSIEVAHRPNEFLPVAEFRRAGEVLDELIDRNCVRA